MNLTKTLQAVADPTRRKILEILKKKDLTAGEIKDNFYLTFPTLSHHLNVLKNAGLVSSRKNGQEVIYSLNLSVFEETTAYLIKLFKK